MLQQGFGSIISQTLNQSHSFWISSQYHDSIITILFNKTSHNRRQLYRIIKSRFNILARFCKTF